MIASVVMSFFIPSGAMSPTVSARPACSASAPCCSASSVSRPSGCSITIPTTIFMSASLWPCRLVSCTPPCSGPCRASSPTASTLRPLFRHFFRLSVSGIFAAGLTPMVATMLVAWNGGEPWYLCAYLGSAGLISAACTLWIRHLNRKGFPPALPVEGETPVSEPLMEGESA